MGVIEVTVINWRVFNPKSDKTRHPHWFRINQDIAASAALFDLSPAQKWAWVCVLGICCKKDSETISINPKHISQMSGVKENEIHKAIQILEENGTLTVNRQQTVRQLTTHNITVPTEHNITLHNNCDQPADCLPSGKTAGSLAFESYAAEYKIRYKTEPVRNKKVNSQFKSLAERLGVEAPKVAEFYVQHNDFIYVKNGHAPDFLLKHAEKLRTEWFTGSKITTQYSRQAENKDHLEQQLNRIKSGEL